MPEPAFLSLVGSAKIALTLAILAAAMYSFVREKLPPDVTSLLVILALLVTGILKPAEAFAGFSHPATISVCAMLVLTAGLEHTGALTYLARRVIAPLGRWEWLLALSVMGVAATLSAFVVNTATVAVFIPVILDVCRRTGAHPGRLLMPMSHAATLGGMCTLIGTSTNLAAHEFARSQGLAGYSMFELSRVGLPMLLVGAAYIFFVGRFLLPRGLVANAPLRRRGAFITEIVVPPESNWIGREVRPQSLQRDHEVELVFLQRQGAGIDLASEPRPRFAAGDRLRLRGALERLLEFEAHSDLVFRRPSDRLPVSSEGREMGEFVVLPRASVLGLTVKDSGFSNRFDAMVLALQRPGETLAEAIGRTTLHAGDVLLVEGTSAALQALSDRHGFLHVGSPAQPEPRREKLWIAALTLVGVVVMVTFRWLPIVTAATAGCAVLMLSGCLKPREAYRAIDWSIVFVLAGALALGTSLEKTGVTSGLAGALAGLPLVAGPTAVLIGFFLVAALLSEFMSNSATVLLLGPIAVSSAQQMGLNPMALLTAVTFGSSAAFALPIGYQTSLMIYGPGGYRFRDFVRMGLVLDVLLAVIALWLIPRFWPLVLR